MTYIMYVTFQIMLDCRLSCQHKLHDLGEDIDNSLANQH